MEHLAPSGLPDLPGAPETPAPLEPDQLAPPDPRDQRQLSPGPPEQRAHPLRDQRALQVHPLLAQLEQLQRFPDRPEPLDLLERPDQVALDQPAPREQLQRSPAQQAQLVAQAQLAPLALVFIRKQITLLLARRLSPGIAGCKRILA